MITLYLHFFVGMYMATVLPHSDSFLYWSLAYIREGISDLRIYVAVASPYPRERGGARPNDSLSLKFDRNWWLCLRTIEKDIWGRVEAKERRFRWTFCWQRLSSDPRMNLDPTKNKPQICQEEVYKVQGIFNCEGCQAAMNLSPS